MSDPLNDELREIISEYGLTRRQAAEMMMMSTSNMDRYLAPPRRGRSRNPAYRTLPAYRLKLLIQEITIRKLTKVEEAQ